MIDQNASIMIVDDEEAVRQNLEIYLEDENFEIYGADRGKVAVELAQNNSIDLAIVDMRLPDTDGESLILELNKIQPTMKYLIHTGSIDYVLPPKMLALGIKESHILHKPMSDMGQLVDIINEAISH